MSAPVRIRKIRQGLHPRHVTVIAMAVMVETGLRTMTLPRLTTLLRVRLSTDQEPPSNDGPVDPKTFPRVRSSRYGRAIDRVLRRWPFGDTCLRRALLLGFFLRRHDPSLVIGVRRDDAGRIAAHAWVVVAGVTLDPSAAQYQSFGDAAE